MRRVAILERAGESLMLDVSLRPAKPLAADIRRNLGREFLAFVPPPGSA
jgi:hypothetical protein